MPLVQTDAEVTVCTLVYREPRWIDWWKEGLTQAKTETRYRTLVLANDPEPKVRESECWDVSLANSDPAAHYLGRVYNAWNECMMIAPTELVVLTNSDMFMSDYWLDELMECKRQKPKSLPCSLLVENGRIPSGMPEYVKDFGTNPADFRAADFRTLASTLRKRGTYEPGRLFQPALFDRQSFLDIGPYTSNQGDKSGDRILFEKYQAEGWEWVTCKGSVVSHLQEGEKRWNP